MNINPCSCAALASVVLMAFSAQAAPSRLRQDVPPGTYSVGYRILYLHDATRQGRLVQISVWYPAQPSQVARHITFRSYVEGYFPPANLAARGLNDQEKRDTEALYGSTTFRDVARADVERLLDTETTAFPDAPAARGSYPVVLFATGGGGTPLTHFPTLELLASYGYYVFTEPSPGRDGLPVYLDAVTLDQKVRDMEMPLTLQREYPNADFDRLLVAGFSLGGGSAMLYAQRHPEVRGVASLDGSFGFAPYVDFHGNGGQFEAYRVVCPILHINVAGYPYNDSRLIDSLIFSDRITISLPESAHHSFVAGELISSIVTRTLNESYRMAYNFMCKALVEFSNAAVAQDRPSNLTTLVNSMNPPKGAIVRTLKAVSPPPPEADLYGRLLAPGGIEKLKAEKAEYDSIRREHPSARFARETVMEAAAVELKSQRRLDEAVAVCEWNLTQYPDSWRAENALASSFRERGDVVQARAHYPQSLRLQKNTEAELALAKLDSADRK